MGNVRRQTRLQAHKEASEGHCSAQERTPEKASVATCRID